MKKFLSSKFFIVLMPILTLVIGGIAGWLLGYQPNVTGEVSGSTYGFLKEWGGEVSGSTSGSTSTEYIFQIKTAIGYWLMALIISLAVLLLCILIRKVYTAQKQPGNYEENN